MKDGLVLATLTLRVTEVHVVDTRPPEVKAKAALVASLQQEVLANKRAWRAALRAGQVEQAQAHLAHARVLKERLVGLGANPWHWSRWRGL